MALDRIYELVRKEDVVLFFGAGMSIYAGFPSGNQLANIIYEKLTPSEVEEIPQGLTLPDLCEQFVDIRKSKNSLIALLKTLYEITPKDDHIHKVVASIPHFKTIITTNYDRLFEKVYGDGCTVIRQSADLPYLKKGLPEIFKIHGDLALPDTILITKTDYTKFFDSQKQDVLWTVVKERISTRNVLFIGYSLDDVNMESIFRKMREHLGDNHKELFLLAPGLKTPKVSRLAKDDIHYIDSTAEEFLKGLVDDIKNNIRKDFEAQWCSPETFRIFLQTHHLAPTISAENDQYKLSGMKTMNGHLKGRLTFRVSGDQSEVIRKFENILENREIDTVTLDEQTVSNLNIFLNDIKISTGEDGPLILSSAPVRKAIVDLSFANGVDFEDIQVDVYVTRTQVIFVLPFNGVELKIITSPEKIKDSEFVLKLQRSNNFGRLSDELRIFRLLKELSTEQDLDIFIKGQTSFKFKSSNIAELVTFTDSHLYYLECLKKIEKHFNIKFDRIGEITQQSFAILNIIIAHIEGKPYLCVYKEAWRVQPTDAKHALLLLEQLKPNSMLIQRSGEYQKFDFHGQKIEMGYQQVQLLDPYVLDVEAIKMSPLTPFDIYSKSETIAITFLKSLD